MTIPEMHGWILYTGAEVRELTRYCEEAGRAGVRMEVVAPKELDLVLDTAAPARLFRRGVAVPLPQFVIAAFVEEIDDYNMALLQQLETQGVLCVNRAAVLKKTGDKLLTLQLLAAAGIPVPRTILVKPDTTPAFVLEQLGLPVVVKVIDGGKGHGVTLVQTADELAGLLEMLAAAGASTGILAQEFIADSRGRDLRVLVIDGQPRVGMLRRNRAPGGFKSNISAGGAAEEYPLTDAIRELSLRVCKLLELNIGGLDLLFKGDGFVVGEANSVPGFQGIERCTTMNVPVEMLKSIARQVAARAASTPVAGFVSLDDLRDLTDRELARRFTACCGSVAATQEAVLLDIIRRGAGTAYGKGHDFAGIRTVADFRRRVPVGDWQDHAPYTKRCEAGEKDVLFPGGTPYFVCTSGTTGEMKLLPESDAGALAKSLVSRLRLAILMQQLPGLQQGTFIPLSNASVMGRTAAGIPYGSASGLTLAGTQRAIVERMAFPPAVMQATDPATVDYLIMRHAVARSDVRLIVGNNPGRMTLLAEFADRHRDRLISDIERGVLDAGIELAPELRQKLATELCPDPQRAAVLRRLVAAQGKLSPRDYWPDLNMVSCWLGGTIGRYLDGLKPWLPSRVVFLDCGYGASEGKFNIPTQLNDPAGALAIMGYFFEFVPCAGGEPLLAHELKDGGEYRLIVTSYSGLYRLDLHDIVGVSGFTGDNPNIRFLSKTRDVANIAGEKLTSSCLTEVVTAALAERGLRARHYCVIADSTRHGYDFCLEPDGDDEPDEHWLTCLTAQLDGQPVYSLLSKQGLIRMPRLLVMRRGWLQRLQEEKVRPGVSISQLKLPLLCDTVPLPEFIARTVEL